MRKRPVRIWLLLLLVTLTACAKPTTWPGAAPDGTKLRCWVNEKQGVIECKAAKP